MTFTHLEVHSHFTLLGAIPSVTELAARAAANGLTHLALTDTNALYGAVAFARACHEVGIQPIIGMTITMAESPGSPRVPPSSSEFPRVSSEFPQVPSFPGHLVLLAKDSTGYRSLCRLSSLIQGSPERELLTAHGMNWNDLAVHREGLICLSGGRAGWIERYLRAGDRGSAQIYAGRLAGIFDEDAYLALELHERADEAVAAEVIALGRRLGVQTVAVQPVYCLSPDDAPRLRLLAAIAQNARLAAPVILSGLTNEDSRTEDTSEESVTAFSACPECNEGTSPLDSPRVAVIARGHSPEAIRGMGKDCFVAQPAPRNDRIAIRDSEESRDRHWLSPAEIAARFAAFPQAVAATGEIAARCGSVLPDGRPIWPALKLPPDQTPDEALTALAEAGLAAKYAPRTTQYAVRSTQYATGASRLAHELSAIARHGYAPLFLVVADIVRFARRSGIPVSTRGSVANSLVAYCAGITTVDPIAHDLLFERFLSPARAEPPDIDMDFCSVRRDEVLAYVRDTYGPEHVALVGTISTLQPQGAVREVSKAYGLDESQIGRIMPLLPHRWHPDPRRRDQRTVDDVIRELDDPLLREVVAAAWTLIGQPDHLSVHPGGVVITPGPLTDIVPVQWAPKGFLFTQYDHGDVEAIGLPKLDLLGIRALTVLAAAAAAVKRNHDPAFRVEEIPLDDPPTGDLLARGETIGVFQCESDGAQRTLRKLRARTVADLAIANAFFKPGPATGGMAGAFVRRYRGEEAVRYLHPVLARILGPTKGVLIFQEQILRVATEIAGLNWAQADHLRRGMSHFGVDQMQAMAEQFIQGCMRLAPDGPGFTRQQAQTLWEQVLPFAGYGFNQGHATAYADVSYRSAYLKTHWPAEFLCARLANWGGFHHPAIYMAEAVRLGIAVRPPHVNVSGEGFTLNGGTGEQRGGGAGEQDEKRKTKNENRTTHDAPRTTQYAVRSTQHALWMGLGAVRDFRHSAIHAIIAERSRRPFAGLRDLLSRVELQAKEVTHLVQCGALDGLAASRAELLAEAEEITRGGRRLEGAQQMAFDFARPQVTAETPAQRLAWEQRILGQPISVHPLALVAARLPSHLPLRRLAESPGRPITVVGVRLPGWTGGPGFFLGDGDTFVIVKSEGKAPPAWQPVIVRGRWVGDGWGGFWLQADQVVAVIAALPSAPGTAA
ncbi:MAG: DNA polymerase III subunit alpha [Chloroflexi bacterium]|nr:DNA polymerase III subunit alpha [Chloroflexota bacterium]